MEFILVVVSHPHISAFLRLQFRDSGFNIDISGWDVSRVRKTKSMFHDSGEFGPLCHIFSQKIIGLNAAFNQDISAWNFGSLEDASEMFRGSNYNIDIKWNNTGRLDNVNDFVSTISVPSFQVAHVFV